LLGPYCDNRSSGSDDTDSKDDENKAPSFILTRAKAKNKSKVTAKTASEAGRKNLRKRAKT
jgi:hypothetical protein